MTPPPPLRRAEEATKEKMGSIAGGNGFAAGHETTILKNCQLKRGGVGEGRPWVAVFPSP